MSEPDLPAFLNLSLTDTERATAWNGIKAPYAAKVAKRKRKAAREAGNEDEGWRRSWET